MSPLRKTIAALFFTASVAACTGIPQNVEPVTGFEIERYLGTWYEIARLDHRFERGLNNVTATYTRRADGGIDVFNRGFNPEKGEWSSARGRAYLAGEPDVGRLKVSFFRPFYAGYNIIALDREDYRYALVCGHSRSYLWILSRSPFLEPAVLERLVAKAQSLGFSTEELIIVDHDQSADADRGYGDDTYGVR